MREGAREGGSRRGGRVGGLGRGPLAAVRKGLGTLTGRADAFPGLGGGASSAVLCGFTSCLCGLQVCEGTTGHAEVVQVRRAERSGRLALCACVLVCMCDRCAHIICSKTVLMHDACRMHGAMRIAAKHF